QYANILHKRKYKKFKLNYSQSTEKDSENWYIIEFETDRNKWSYTNRGFPTKYSGRVYVDKQTFAIVRVVENWKTALNQNEIKTYFKHSEGLKNVFQITLKEENEVHFSSIDNSVYYATEYFGRTISEKITDKGAFENDVSEIHSKAFNFITDAVEEIAYPHQVKENVELNRVSYN